MNAIEEQIKETLERLGVKGTATIIPVGFHRYEVSVNDEYFGIFDIDRNTFVD